jgi:predicted transcriptional regulator
MTQKSVMQMTPAEYQACRAAAIRARSEPESMAALRSEIAARRGDAPRDAREMTDAEFKAAKLAAIRGVTRGRR